MNKSLLFGTFTFLFLFASSNKTVAQQRNHEQIESILLKHKQKNKTSTDYSIKIRSTELVDKSILSSRDEAFYIYKTEECEQNSFVIVSGDERMPEILAYSSESTFDLDNIPPAVRYWLNCYVEEFNQLDNYKSDIPTKQNVTLSNESISPLLNQVQWGQAKPYNNLCPSCRGERTLTGCVATAMAQVMKYYSFPDKGCGYINYNTSTNRLNVKHDFSNDIFDWQNMLNHYVSDYSDKQANAVAVLMASCGASVEMDYGTASQGGSGAYQADLLKGYIENFGYDDDASLVIRSYCTIDDWHRLLLNELNAGRPVNYGGASMRDGGHSFVIDGYRMGDNQYPNYHVNWGWDGSCDGYYQLANLHPQEDGIYATNNPFSESQQMTIGIKPEDGINDNSILLLSSRINCNMSKVKRGGELLCKVSSLYNCSYKDFNGTISVALKSESGDFIIIAEGLRRGLKYLEGMGSVSFECSIPNYVEEGKYSICMVHKFTSSDKWVEVLSASYAAVDVTKNENEETGTECMWAEIGCSEFELLYGDKQNIIAANIYELINLDTAPFKGSLSFAVADENGSQMFLFGTSGDDIEIGYKDYLTEPVHISGTIDRELADGHYRLYISANSSGQMFGSYVVQNDLSFSDAPTKELYYRIEVRNGIANINGKEYIICPTGITCINKDERHDMPCLSLDGKRIKDIPKQRGIYLLQNGKQSKKVYVP
ncbi:MAG: C10 family peptidase [Prevotella sp.]